MKTINFLTPVSFNKEKTLLSQSVLEAVDSYLSFGNRIAQVEIIHSDGRKVGVELLSERNYSPFLHTATLLSFFAISHFTIVIPIIALAVKIALRNGYEFYETPNLVKEIESGIAIPHSLEGKMALIEEGIPAQGVAFINENTFSIENHLYEIGGNFQNLVKAKKVCLAHSLDLLDIVHAKTTRVGNQHLLIKQQAILDLSTATIPQIKQLITFYVQTEGAKSAIDLIGKLHTQEQIDAAIRALTEQCEVNKEAIAQAKARRLQELERESGIRQAGYFQAKKQEFPSLVYFKPV